MPIRVLDSPTFQPPLTVLAAGVRMTYRVKEVFYTLQGERRNTGRAAVSCRFTGRVCNLWSGRPEDRDRVPSCSQWCDTDFVGTDGRAAKALELYGIERALPPLLPPSDDPTQRELRRQREEQRRQLR